jgi:hypothetical protein
MQNKFNPTSSNLKTSKQRSGLRPKSSPNNVLKNRDTEAPPPLDDTGDESFFEVEADSAEEAKKYHRISHTVEIVKICLVLLLLAIER